MTDTTDTNAQENSNSENGELDANAEAHDTSEHGEEGEATTEGEGSASDEGADTGTDDGSRTDDEAARRKARAQSQIDRLKEENRKLKKQLEENDVTSNASEVVIARLEARGILESEDQALVLKFAKSEEVDPIDAINDPFIKARLEHNKQLREQRKATPAPSNRTGTPTKRDAQWYADNNKVPDASKDRKVFEDWQDLMARRSRGY